MSVGFIFFFKRMILNIQLKILNVMPHGTCYSKYFYLQIDPQCNLDFQEGTHLVLLQRDVLNVSYMLLCIAGTFLKSGLK